MARFWALADSDDTFNRYKAAIGTAISSVQDLTLGTAVADAPRGQMAAPVSVTRPDGAFGQGVSGVYVGLERGLSASAGLGQGPQQTYNQNTGQFETSSTGMAPGVQTSIADYTEVDVLFPDGSYRRRMPDRGLASDLAWDRQNRQPLWGTWSRQGDVIVTNRSGYKTTYRINGNELISERDRAWVKLALPQNERIDGSFARADYRDAGAPRLVLYADGRYEDRGGFLRMVGSASNLVVPDGHTLVSRWTDAEAQQALAGLNRHLGTDPEGVRTAAADRQAQGARSAGPRGVVAQQPRRPVVRRDQQVLVPVTVEVTGHHPAGGAGVALAEQGRGRLLEAAGGGRQEEVVGLSDADAGGLVVGARVAVGDEQVEVAIELEVQQGRPPARHPDACGGDARRRSLASL